MKNAFVLMTAMPPTFGHKALIDFASYLDVEYVNVLVNVQPDEPFGYARYHALCRAFINNDQIQIRYYDKFIQQNPKDDSDDAFWQMWVDLMVKYGYTEGDYLVASENYGIRLAQEANAVFMPYDPDRSIVPTKATSIRENTLDNFDQILPEFRHILRKRITVFGAESTGKTTLSRALAEALRSQWLPEYARPYLETVGNELDDEVMSRIAKGQMAYQLMGYDSLDPFLIQDTDLFSTIGYWEFWSPDTVPDDLYNDAFATKSHLYIITRSNIPFEPDPLRYGGDHREADDDYWISLADRCGLNYIVIDEADHTKRLEIAVGAAREIFGNPLSYEREV